MSQQLRQNLALPDDPVPGLVLLQFIARWREFGTDVSEELGIEVFFGIGCHHGNLADYAGMPVGKVCSAAADANDQTGFFQY